MKTNSLPMKHVSVIEQKQLKRLTEQRNTAIILQLYAVKKSELNSKKLPLLPANDRRKRIAETYVLKRDKHSLREVIASYLYNLPGFHSKRSAT